MSESEEDQNWRYGRVVKEFLALEKTQRYESMAIPFLKSGHIPDEVILAVALQSESEGWTDKKKYSSVLMERCYRHIRAHVSKLPQLQAKGGGFDAVSDDAVGFVFEKLLSSKADQKYASKKFGSLIYRRYLDFVDTYYSSFYETKEPEVEAYENHTDSELDDESYGQEGYVESLLKRLKEETEEDDKYSEVRLLINDTHFLSKSERIAFTLHCVGEINISSKKPDKVTVCKLMDRSDKQVRLYIQSALTKLREKLK